MSSLLRAKDIEVRYGGVRALDHVSIEVTAGEIVGLIGPNGAGKTTLFEVLAGFTPPRAGTIEFAGEEIARVAPEGRAQRGLIRSFQDARLFESLTVFQALLLAHEKRHPSRVWRDVTALPNARRSEKARRAAAEDLLATMGLARYGDTLITELSTGTRRVVELACVVALEPVLLLLDEPSSGIAQREVEALGPLLLRIKAQTGCTIVIIEHDMPLVMGLADRIVALDAGQVLAEGTPAEVQRHPGVIESYLGASAAITQRSGVAKDRKAAKK